MDSVIRLLNNWGQVCKTVNKRLVRECDFQYQSSGEYVQCIIIQHSIKLVSFFSGESALHMAIVNENQEMVHFLCKHSADIHERAYGAFFCPEDQRLSRKDTSNQEGIILDDKTDYER